MTTDPTTNNSSSASDFEGEDLTYSAALEELEELLDQLEVADVDVDHLAERVARGVKLVRFCRTRLDVVTNDVQSVVSELLAPDPLSESDDTYDDDSDFDNSDLDNSDLDNSELDNSELDNSELDNSELDEQDE